MGYDKFKRNNQARSLVNRFKTTRDKVVRIKSTITFLIRCRKSGIFPNFITNSTRNIQNIFSENGLPSIQQHISNYTQELHNKLLNLTIKEKHMLLKDTNNEIAFIKSNLGRYFSEEEIREFLEYENIKKKIIR